MFRRIYTYLSARNLPGLWLAPVVVRLLKLQRNGVLNVFAKLMPQKILSSRSLDAWAFETPFTTDDVASLRAIRVSSSRHKIVTSCDGGFGKPRILGWGEKGHLEERQITALPLWLGNSVEVRSHVAVTNFISNQSNLYHFYLHNLLPLILLNSARAPKVPRRLLLLESPGEYQKRLMEMLDVEWEYRRNHAICRRVSVIDVKPQIVSDAISYFRATPEWRELRDSWKSSAAPTRVYLARRSRRPSNQAVVARIGNEFGYKQIFFEDLSFEDQIALGSGVRHWLADHGAGLTHMIWGKPSSLIELVFLTAERRPFGDECFGDLLGELDPLARYLPVVGTTSALAGVTRQGKMRNPKPVPNEFHVPIPSLRAALTEIHGS